MPLDRVIYVQMTARFKSFEPGEKPRIEPGIKKWFEPPSKTVEHLDRPFFIRDRSLLTWPVHVSTLSLVNLYMNVLDKVKRNDNWGDFILMNLILLRLTNLIVRG